MKRIYFILICLSYTVATFAQWGNNQRQGQNQQQTEQRNQWQQQGQRQFSPELFNKQLEQFVKNNAGLSASECQKLFPLMHEMLNKQREVNGKIQYTISQGFGDKEEKEYEDIITKVTNLEVESKKIEQTYYKKFHTILSWKKIYRVRFALSRWNMEVLRMLNPQQQQPATRIQQSWPGQRQLGGQNRRDMQTPYWNQHKTNE
jgi:hypothetical protein